MPLSKGIKSKLKSFTIYISNFRLYRGGGSVSKSVRPAIGKLGVRIPAVKTGNDSSAAKRSAMGVSVTGPRR